MWSWVLEGVGLTGALIVGRKHFYGWAILLGNTVLWSVYGITKHEYGFVVASFAYAPVYARNLIRWYQARNANV